MRLKLVFINFINFSIFFRMNIKVLIIFDSRLSGQDLQFFFKCHQNKYKNE